MLTVKEQINKQLGLLSNKSLYLTNIVTYTNSILPITKNHNISVFIINKLYKNYIKNSTLNIKNVYNNTNEINYKIINNKKINKYKLSVITKNNKKYIYSNSFNKTNISYLKKTFLKQEHLQLNIPVNNVKNTIKNFVNTPVQQFITQLFFNTIKLQQNLINLKTKKNIKLFFNNSYFNFQPQFKKAFDITSGLQTIETIIESRTKYNNMYLLSPIIGYICSYNEQVYSSVNEAYNINSCINTLYFGQCINLQLNQLSNKKIILETNTSILKSNYPITSGIYAPHHILISYYTFSKLYYNQYKSSKNTLIFIANIIIESIVKQYISNKIFLPGAYFELIVKRITSFVLIINTGDSSFEINDLVSILIIKTINNALNKFSYKQTRYTPILIGITKSTLAASGLLSSVSFQSTLKILSKQLLEKNCDWLNDIKSNIIATSLVPLGTGWYRYYQKINS
eukprot:GHVT01023793.1.p10 GENE.GHVT01023793.1~~GHVT01023793.1.p10  ORF type:complete len:455 (-),score=-31.11 GHVT01023793.1:291-1655(-)